MINNNTEKATKKRIENLIRYVPESMFFPNYMRQVLVLVTFQLCSRI